MIRIHVIGTRGFPNVQGGVETHCEELYKRLAVYNDLEIRVYRRSCYLKNQPAENVYNTIEFVDIWAPKNKYFETITHTFLCVIMSLYRRPDIIHFHNMGPGLFIPFVRLFSIKTVLTYHSQNYLHKKWGWFSQLILRLGEIISIKFSNKVIFISNNIKNYMESKYQIKNFEYISNGVNVTGKSDSKDYLDSLKLISGKYILAVGRFTPEKGFDYLIKAYIELGVIEYKLVLVGEADRASKYSNDLIKSVHDNKNIVLTGFINGEDLRQIYSNAYLFVISSYQEGLPLVLLDAMNYGLNILASDIPANIEAGLDKNCYFKTGDVKDLKDKIDKTLIEHKSGANYKENLEDNYNWDKSAKATYNIYKLLSKK